MLYLPETLRYLARHGVSARGTQDVEAELLQIKAALASQSSGAASREAAPGGIVGRRELSERH
jgi:hypothetical protein